MPKTLRNAILGTLAVVGGLEGIGAVATELTNNVPISVTSIKTDLAWPWHLIESAFEQKSNVIYNYPDKVTIDSDNLIAVTNLDIIKDIPTLPATSTPKHDIYLLQPVANLDITKPLEYGLDLAGKSDRNPVFQEIYRQEAIKNNVRNMLKIPNVPKDSIIVALVDGKLMFTHMAQADPDGAVDKAEIIYTALDGTEQFVDIGMGAGQFPIPLLDVTPFTGNNARSYVDVKRGQPIMKTSQDGDILISTAARPSQSLTDYYPTNINFLTIPDPINSEQKTVMPETQ